MNDPIDISIPLRFNGPQPNAYGVEPATSSPVKAGSLVGDTRLGGSVNFEQYTFIPHCSGTHTECVGHITHERISVRDCLKDVIIPAILISVAPIERRETDETYPSGAESDLVITRAVLEAKLRDMCLPILDSRFLTTESSALIVRTLPNDGTKLTREYGSADIPPYFTTEAIIHIVGSGFKHLLVDMPSIDRIFDEGLLSNHRTFWNVEPASFEFTPGTRLHSTVTELIYVQREVPDGAYLLNIQIAPFDSDSSPSRPVLLRP